MEKTIEVNGKTYYLKSKAGYLPDAYGDYGYRLIVQVYERKGIFKSLLTTRRGKNYYRNKDIIDKIEKEYEEEMRPSIIEEILGKQKIDKFNKKLLDKKKKI